MGSRRCVGSTAIWLLLAVSGLGCESAEAKCKRLQEGSAKAWTAHADALGKELDAARSARDRAKHELDGDLKLRHQAEARRHADELHGPEKSSAWYRAFLSAEQAQCAKDPDCLELKVQIDQAEEQLAALAPRIEAARAAALAAKGPVADAERAVRVVPRDRERADAEAAHAASEEAIAACKAAER